MNIKLDQSFILCRVFSGPCRAMFQTNLLHLFLSVDNDVNCRLAPRPRRDAVCHAVLSFSLHRLRHSCASCISEHVLFLLNDQHEFN